MNPLPYDPQALKALAVSDSGFVFDPRTGHSYSLNRTGLALLRAMQEGLVPVAISARLGDLFEDVGRVDDDVDAFITALRDFGLLPPTDARSGSQP
jgi:hypothetical protein